MAILDLQGMEEARRVQGHGHGPAHSGASKGCFNDFSGLSVILC
jgi:hypothetical protein